MDVACPFVCIVPCLTHLVVVVITPPLAAAVVGMSCCGPHTCHGYLPNRRMEERKPVTL